MLGGREGVTVLWFGGCKNGRAPLYNISIAGVRITPLGRREKVAVTWFLVCVSYTVLKKCSMKSQFKLN